MIPDEESLDVVLVDLTAVTFIDSSGVRLMLGLHARCERAGRRLVVVCEDGPARRVFDLCGLGDWAPLVAAHPRPALRVVA